MVLDVVRDATIDIARNEHNERPVVGVPGHSIEAHTFIYTTQFAEPVCRPGSPRTYSGASCLRKAHASDPCPTPDLASLQAWASSCNLHDASSGLEKGHSPRLF
jgi:hypothetical protein